MSTAVIPEPIAQLQRQLDQIRNTQPRGKKLRDSVWQAAVELAREHGVYSVAHPLRLDYTGLKKRLGGVSHRRRKARKPAFVELIAPSSAMPRECHATLYTESSDSFLPPLPPRLLPGGANQFPGGSCTRCSQAPFTAHCYANYG